MTQRKRLFLRELIHSKTRIHQKWARRASVLFPGDVPYVHHFCAQRSPTTVAPRIWSSMTHSRYNHSRAIISYLADVPVPTSAQFDWKSSNHRISKKIYSHGTIKASLERKFDAEQESMRNKSKSGGRSIILSCHTCKTFSSPVQSVQSNRRISRSTLCQHDTKRVSIERQLIVKTS
jgi:hypothetical protein